MSELKKGKYVPVSARIIQMAVGQEVEAVFDTAENKIFLLVEQVPKEFQVKQVSTTEPAVEPQPKKAAPPTKDEEEVEATDIMALTDDGMALMPAAALQAICEEFGIEIPKDGKNTNKKLRSLILAYQATADGDEEEEISQLPTPKEKSFDIAKYADQAAEGKIDQVEFEAVVKTSITDKALQTKVLEAIAEWYEDADATADELVESVQPFLSDIEEAPAKAGKVASKKYVAVDVKDLKTDDEVRVYWASHEEWFTGVVKVTKGKVFVTYDIDQAVEVIDPKEHTAIERKASRL